MKKTELAELRQELLATGEYKTHPECRAKCRAKIGALTTLRLAWNTMRVFPMCALYEPLGKLTQESWAELCFSSVTGIEALGMNFILEGWKNRIAYDGPVMYLCNHMSTLETIFMPPITLTFGAINFVAKDSLGRLPFLKDAAKHMGMVTVGRKSPRADLTRILTVGSEHIKKGNSFLIYPQGTRQAVFSRERFSSIGAKLAERVGCPICPVVVDTRCLPTRKSGVLATIFKDFGTVNPSFDVKCCCGPLIPAGKSKEMHEQSFEWMASKLEDWGLPVKR